MLGRGEGRNVSAIQLLKEGYSGGAIRTACAYIGIMKPLKNILGVY
jgi:hypothetical protein